MNPMELEAFVLIVITGAVCVVGWFVGRILKNDRSERRTIDS